MVQYEFEKRKCHVQSGISLFSSKIICGKCGSFYGSKVWHSNSKYRRVIWRCNNKYIKKESYNTPHVTEQQIKESFTNAVNSLIMDKKSIMDECEKLILELTDMSLIEEKEIRLQGERDVIYNLLKDLVAQVAHPQNDACEDNEKVDCNIERELPARAPRIDQNEYNDKYESLKELYDKINEKLSKIEDLKFEMRTKRHKAEEFIESLKQSSELLTEFDERMWYALFEKAIVNTDGRMNFEFKNGKIIK